MRTAITVLLLALALPATAADFQVVDISHEVVETEQGSVVAHKLEAQTGNLSEIKADIVGYFLWVQVPGAEIVSVDVSDPSIIQAVIHLDGTVDLIRETVEVPTPAPERVDLAVEYPASFSVRVPEGVS